MFEKITAFFLALIASFFTPVAVFNYNGENTPAVTQDVTVMAYNVYVFGTGEKSPEARTNGVVQTIKNVMPDSFGVEEADEGWVSRLSDALPEYGCAGLGRDEGGAGEASPVFYLKDKFELVKTETFWLSPTPDEPSRAWDAWLNRICTVAVLRDKVSGFTYAHFNAHFDNIGAISRNESVAVISKKISEYNLPCVLSGDLNGKEDTLMYDRICEMGLLDTKYLAKDSDSGATYHAYTSADKTNDKPIDYIFVSDSVNEVYSYKIIRDKVDGVYPSDHYPVVAKFNMTYGKDAVK